MEIKQDKCDDNDDSSIYIYIYIMKQNYKKNIYADIQIILKY